MDLNLTDVLCYRSCDSSIPNYNNNDKLGDISLSLNNLNTHKETPVSEDDDCALFLGLGPAPNFYNKNSERGELPATVGKELGNQVDSGILQLGLFSGGDVDPVMSMDQTHHSSSSFESHMYPPGPNLFVSATDDGSTSAKMSLGGYMPSLLLAPVLDNSRRKKRSMPETKDPQHQFQFSPEISATTDCSVGAVSNSKGNDCGDSLNHHVQPKNCRFKGCTKGARGATRLCIGHGGGQRCQRHGCGKGAECRTVFCKAHGGGRRCQQLGCTKSAEGKTDFCIAHGGGRRCGREGCTKAARGKSGLCIRHGGGKRCTVEGCTRSAEGQVGLCISHGGGRRCQFPNCGKGAQGSTMHCKAHGGGKRCIFEGCDKGAEGSTPFCKGHGGGKRCLYEGGGNCPKSVHGGTDFCVAHGGGKRCAVPCCTKSARGRTDCCVRHGGGKRCIFSSCDKSAQGSTDFCKAHGGGKRCNWSQGCEKFARGKSGLCAAHSSSVAFRRKEKDPQTGTTGNMIIPQLFNGIVSASTTIGSSIENDHTCSELSASSENNKLSSLFLPFSMNLPVQNPAPEDASEGKLRLAVPEGRVHGGRLLTLLGGNFQNIGVNINTQGRST
ncbi:Loricrin-like protein [Zostera marina]|uniref:Loricrin-like protein n=1 Tax=Zostera marina TaxID=29655 RepID=A0A0K9PQH3_ZOSMR|nr:Loricrin-like protein [Zostera marina]